MQTAFWVAAALLVTGRAAVAQIHLTSVQPDGQVRWTGAFTAGVVSVVTAADVTGPWSVLENHFTTAPTGGTRLGLRPGNLFCRLLSVDISTNTPWHHTNLVQSYGLLETIAGTNMPGGGVDKSNYWRPWYEGGPATNACLSRPHNAFADPENNILIVDQGSGSVLKVTPAGTIHTFAGTHTNGFNGDGPAPATNLALNFPNGGWMAEDGRFYILDTDNRRIRRVDPNGIMTTVVTNADAVGEGRGLWVKSDESLLYFCALTRLRKWTPAGGVVTLPHVFLNLANILGDERTGDLYICDRDAHRIYRLDTNGVLTTFAGNGTTGPRTEGTPVLQFGFNRPRDLCFLPNGGYLVSEHNPGNCVWYVDPAGRVHLWLNGNSSNNAYRGDGAWFYANLATPKVSKVRSIKTDRRGNLLIVENDIGYLRRVNFRRLNP